MVRCPDCHSQVSEWAARCPTCGADVTAAEFSPATPASEVHIASHGLSDRRFALTVGAAVTAAVVAAVVAATLAVVSGHNGHPVAGRPPSPPSTVLPVTPTTAAAVSATTAVLPSTTVPSLLGQSENSLVDLTWISDTTGWALISVPCPPTTCPFILSTADGGRTWSPDRNIGAPLAPWSASQGCLSAGCFEHLRFASATTGYLWGQSVGMFITVDGGANWVQQPTTQPLALEAVRGWVVRVTAPGGLANRLEVDRARVGASGWTEAPLSVVGSFGANVFTAAGTIYIAWPGHTAGGAPDAHTQFVRSRDGGATWQSFGDPCGQSGDGTELDASVYAATPNGDLAVLCMPRGASGSPWFTMSLDSGDHFGPLQPVPVNQPGGVALALAGNGKVALVASTGSGSQPSQVIRSTDGGRTWASTLSAPPGNEPGTIPWLGFEDSTTGRVSFGTAALWTTVDAGQTWLPEQIPPSF